MKKKEGGKVVLRVGTAGVEWLGLGMVFAGRYFGAGEL